MVLEIPPMPVGCMCVKTRKEFGRMRTAHNLECNREDDVPYECGDRERVPAQFYSKYYRTNGQTFTKISENKIFANTQSPNSISHTYR